MFATFPINLISVDLLTLAINREYKSDEPIPVTAR